MKLVCVCKQSRRGMDDTLRAGMLVSLRAVRLGDDGDGLSTSTLRELKLLSQLRHAHIIRMLEIVRDKSSDVANNFAYTNPSGITCCAVVPACVNTDWLCQRHMLIFFPPPLPHKICNP